MKNMVSISLILLLSACASTSTDSMVKAEPEKQSINYAETDQSLIKSLVMEGSNPKKEHWVSFIIDCRTEKLVSDVISKAKLVGFDDDYISYSEKRKVWSSSLSSPMNLNLAEVSASRAKLMPLIPIKGCEPVFWGTTMEK
jgi:hypothetical protein